MPSRCGAFLVWKIIPANKKREAPFHCNTLFMKDLLRWNWIQHWCEQWSSIKVRLWTPHPSTWSNGDEASQNEQNIFHSVLSIGSPRFCTCLDSPAVNPHQISPQFFQRIVSMGLPQEWLDGGVKKIDSLWAGRLKKGYLGDVLEGSWGHYPYWGNQRIQMYGNHSALFGLVI